MTRDSLIEAVQRIQAKQMAFRTWMITRLGAADGTAAAEAIIGTPNPGDLSDEQLHLKVQHGLGLPANITVTEDQLAMAVEIKMARRREASALPL
jgi:hypothetical protein